MELRQLRYFVTLAEELNYRRAAERLHIAQPSLSQQIMALERELGTPLLVRDSKHVELTEAGRALLPEARRTLQQARRTREAARLAARGEVGSLHLGHPAYASSPLVRRVIEEFQARQPQIELKVTGATTRVLFAQVVRGELDAAFVRLPVDAGSDLEIRVIERDPLFAAVPIGHPFALRESLSLRDMDGQAFISSDREINPWLYDYWHQSVFPNAGVVFASERMESSLEAILAAVAAGNGIGIVPSVLLDLYRAQGVKYVPFLDNEAVTELGVVWRGLDPGPVLQLFLHLCDEVAMDLEHTTLG